MKQFWIKRDILETPLLKFTNKDELTIRDVIQGNLIIGGAGSGKTSGSGRNLALSLLRQNFGGLVLTAKSSEKDLWIKYCQETGREDSLLIVSPDRIDNPMTFNFLNWESKRPGRGSGHTLNIRQFLVDILDALHTKSGGANEQFWQDQTEKLLDACIELLQLSQTSLTIENIIRILKSAPESIEQINDQNNIRDSFCIALFSKANKIFQQNSSVDDKCCQYRLDIKQRLQLTYEFWFEEFPKNMSDKQKGSLNLIVTGMLQKLRQKPLASLFCGKTTFLPEFSRNGAIILIDLPLDRFREIGRMGQLIMKLAWQRAMESSSDDQVTGRPVFCWADEAQYFVSKTDYRFTGISREYRIATVYLTQNLPSLFSALGNGEEGKRQVKALLGNLQNKFFHANDDPETNMYACDVIGRDKIPLYNSSKTASQGTTLGSGENRNENISSGNFSSGDNSSKSATRNTSDAEGFTETFDYIVQPLEFIKLRRYYKKGRDYYSEAIVFANGKTWSTTGKTFVKCLFQHGH